MNIPSIYEFESERKPQGEVITKIDYDTGKGIYVYLGNHPYATKGLPTQDAITATDKIKKAILLQIRPQNWRKNIIKSHYHYIQPYILKEQYQQPITKELDKLITSIAGDKQLASMLSHVIEYDAAYRFRLQDLFTQTNKELLSQKPIHEIFRLLRINKRRDQLFVHKKFRKFATILILLLLNPKNRLKLKIALKTINYQNLTLDESDKYWISKRNDYKYDA